MPRKYIPIATQGKPDKRKWKKVSLRKPILEALAVILRMRGLDDHDVYTLIEQGIVRLPEYRRVYELLRKQYPDLPPPEE